MRHLLIGLVFLLPLASAYLDVDRLWWDLKQKFRTSVAPLPLDGQPLNVSITAFLTAFKVDSVERVLRANWQLQLVWTDYRLRWNPSKYGDIDMLSVRGKNVWTPFLVAVDSWRTDDQDGDVSNNIFDGNFTVAVYPDGTMWWYTAAVLSSTCDLEMAQFPYDVQTCDLTIKNWDMANDQLNVISDGDEIDMTYLGENSEWEVVTSSATAPGKGGNQDEGGLTFEVKVKRESTYYIMNVVLPTMLMSCVSLLVFLSPSKAEEKTVLAVVVFLSFTVYSTVVVKNIPRAGSTPLLSYYVYGAMMLSTLSIIATLVILNLQYRSARHGPSDTLISVCRKLAKFFCMHAGHLTTARGIEQLPRWKQVMTDTLGAVTIEDKIQQIVAENRRLRLQYRGRTEDLLAMIGEQTRLLGNIVLFKQHRQLVIKEWAFVSRIFDRLFFAAFALMNFVVLLAIIALYPAIEHLI